MTRTVICHFFNEEFLLPWWLRHHRRIFDHGIMIDYRSTDRSRELIRQLCPSWEIHTSRNEFFDSSVIDREVEDYERQCDGWRMALNVTEFLYGNVDQLGDGQRRRQHFLGNYVFIEEGSPSELNPDLPLHEQLRFGYYENDRYSIRKLHLGARASRSVHNFAIDYAPQGGRHWHEMPSLSDLAIFYYGYAANNVKILNRKLQIKSKMSAEEQAARGAEHPNTVTREQFLKNIDLHHRPRCIDLTLEINRLSLFNGYRSLSIKEDRPFISLEMLPRISFGKRMRHATRPWRYKIKELFRRAAR